MEIDILLICDFVIKMADEGVIPNYNEFQSLNFFEQISLIVSYNVGV